jgi:hypothetical protein
VSRRLKIVSLWTAATLGFASAANAADLIWSSFIGGGSNDYPYRLAMDFNGDVYIAGSTESSDFPVTPGAFQTTKRGGQDVFVAKVKGDGTAILWATYLGGSMTDNALALAIDGNNNVYVAGNTTSSDLPVSGSAFRRTYAGGGDGFVAKLTSSGGLSYLTYLGGFADDAIYDITVDGGGNATAVGSSGSVDFPTTAGAVKTILRDGSDGVVVKLNATGSQLAYSTFLGSDGGTDVIYGVALDGQGRATVTGWTTSAAFPVTSGVFDPSFDQFLDGFVTRLNATGTGYVYSTYLSGAGYDEPWTVRVDASGNAYVAGRTASPNFPVSAGGYQRSKAGGTYDGFVVKLSSDARTLVYGTFLGGGGDDYIYGLAINLSGEACVTGYTMSSNFPVTGNAQDPSANGGADAFVSRLSSSGGALPYSTYLGGSGGDHGLGIAARSNGQVVVAGSTGSSGFPVTSGVFDPTWNGPTDGFVFLLSPGVVGSVDVVPPAPITLEISPPRPNPTHDLSTVAATTTRAGAIRVQVLDLQGRLVRTLADEERPAGHYEWTWDGRDDSGRDLGAGVFLFDISAPDAHQVERIVRLR